jgi:hypothetical protein
MEDNPFGSTFLPHSCCEAKFLVDGQEYFHQVFKALEDAEVSLSLSQILSFHSRTIQSQEKNYNFNS